MHDLPTQSGSSSYAPTASSVPGGAPDELSSLIALVEKLEREHTLTFEEWVHLIKGRNTPAPSAIADRPPSAGADSISSAEPSSIADPISSAVSSFAADPVPLAKSPPAMPSSSAVTSFASDRAPLAVPPPAVPSSSAAQPSAAEPSSADDRTPSAVSPSAVPSPAEADPSSSTPSSAPQSRFLIDTLGEDSDDEKLFPVRALVFKKARALRRKYYGNSVYIRGLIEMTNYCKNDCYYCGIRKSNRHIKRYRLTKEQILSCADEGYNLGFRTFVLQGGEDFFYSDDDIAQIVSSIKRAHPDCAVTLSLGEREHKTYQLWFDAGADRYLLRHETADFEHYAKLHPPSLSPLHRQNCLRDLKAIGYQTGAGFMVGSPFQTAEHLAHDMLFLKELEPQMVGIGPFLPHHDTPFASQKPGTVELTVFMLGLIRLMLPRVLLPATTALGTADPLGREKGIRAGANVIMPNLSPTAVRKDYMLYDNKICTGDESAQCRSCISMRMRSIGYEVQITRGDIASER